ncbi:hypothetical protein LRAMOSA10654 [Lichtheimia ramosa]|uniref:Pentatricopeptide repeat-containing protein-mitochondrial domain-containing protein n=1 Tax=Lichtheimia ramosa TaxID=688394 RepID=A0A077WQ66_9FUNG|nr:hypothetical protein LRAMOSA10654 [Lichtheimia ramosa]
MSRPLTRASCTLFRVRLRPRSIHCTTATLRDRLFFHDSRLMLRYLSTATDTTNKEKTVINNNPKSRYRWRQPAHQLTLDGDTPLSPEELKQMVHKKMRQSLGAVADMHLSADHARETIVGLAGILDKNNIAYDTHTYEFLLSAYAKSGDYKMIMPLLEEMLDKEIRPKPSFFHRAFGLAARFGQVRLMARLREIFKHCGYNPNARRVLVEMIHCTCNNGELEHAIDILETMKRSNIIPTLQSYISIVDAALGYGQPDVAFTYLQEAERVHLERHSDIDTLPDHFHPIFIKTLRCAAIKGSYDIVKAAWQIAVNEKKLSPDEGLCQYVLQVAGRHGDSQLSIDVFRILGSLGFSYKESHFAALIESYTPSEDWRNMLKVLYIMRKTGVIPSRETARPIAYKLGRDTKAIRSARDAALQLHKEGALDIVAFNLIIHAFAYNNEATEAFETFASAKDLDLPINIETIDSVLDACIHVKDAATGVSIFNEYVRGEIIPTATTMSKMVTLLCTQDNYEDAFRYLEDTKSMGLVPLRGCYYRLIKKLAISGDARIDMALHDMKACGYDPGESLERYIERYMPQEDQEPESVIKLP